MRHAHPRLPQQHLPLLQKWEVGVEAMDLGHGTTLHQKWGVVAMDLARGIIQQERKKVSIDLLFLASTFLEESSFQASRIVQWFLHWIARDQNVTESWKKLNKEANLPYVVCE